MVILARAAGLPARYVEGYVAKELDTKLGNILLGKNMAMHFRSLYSWLWVDDI